MNEVRADVDRRRPLSFLSDSACPFVDYALGLVGEFCGISLARTQRADAGQVDVYHGNDAARPCALRIPLVDHYDGASIPPDASARDHGDALVAAAPFPFDLFSATRFWLVDEGSAELPDSAYDRHGRLIAGRSAHERAGAREVPIVNTYLLELRRWLEARFEVAGRSRLPAGKRCVVVLSHDVDRPLNPLDLRPTLELAASSVARSRRISGAWYAAIAVGKAIHARCTDRRGRQWLFEELAAEEERRGFRSTFFFAPTSRFSKYGSALDVEYDIRRPEFRRVMRSLVEQGFEVGLHVGYNAGADVARLSDEKRRLEEVAGAAVLGSRHHYWRLGRSLWPALRAHAEAGLRYDSSTAFAEPSGYRLGAAFPFRPWNPELKRPIECVQIPTFLMDGAFFYERRYSVESALARVERLVETLKRCEGIAAIDWHQETSLPRSRRFRRWGEAYLSVIDLLAGDSSVAVSTFRDVLEDAYPSSPSLAPRPSSTTAR